jgi:membrane protein implicated in regulation of membrane protease activity
MFIAVGALLTSAVLYATGWRPSLVETAAIVAGASLLIAIVGRRPLQQFQNADIEEDKSSDLIGRDVTMTHEVTKTHGVVFWSGVEWQARLAADSDIESLAPGARARIVAVQNLALVLAPKRD